MWLHAPSESDVAQDFVDYGLAWLEDRRYSLAVNVEMAKWVEVLKKAPSIGVINPTFNPEFSPLTPKNSFWLDVRTGSHTAAIIAARLFITDDYLELKRSTRLWRDPLRPDDCRLAITVPEGTPTISGRVGHEGGLWVHPQHRKRGLSVILPHLVRALCLREWNIDWQTGLTLREIGECGIAKWAYGMLHVVPCFEGFTPVRPVYDRLFLTYMSREELIAGLNFDAVARLLANGHGQSRHAAVLAQEG